MLLPIDQGIEHGPRDFFPNPDSKDPDYQFRLAAEAGYSALACQIGMAEKYYPDYAGRVPLILKVNGKTDIPSSAKAFSTCNASVEDAVRLGADAVGYTLYVGSPRQDEDLAQLRQVRQDCDRFGMPLVVWSYPRGEAIDAKGGAGSFYAIDYAARMAMEMGADVVKLNMPKIDPAKDKDAPAPYNEMDVGQEEAIRHCVASAGRSLVVLSGGSKVDDETVLTNVRAGDGGRRLGRDLRPQRLAARVERRAGDHRPDQGDAALQRPPHPVGRRRASPSPCLERDDEELARIAVRAAGRGAALLIAAAVGGRRARAGPASAERLRRAGGRRGHDRGADRRRGRGRPLHRRRHAGDGEARRAGAVLRAARLGLQPSSGRGAAGAARLRRSSGATSTGGCSPTSASGGDSSTPSWCGAGWRAR